jgi:hypothetical protein
MKARSVILFLFCATLLFACTKDVRTSSDGSSSIQQQAGNQKIFVSTWEGIDGWVTSAENSNAGLRYSRSVDVPLSNATVLVFARNLWSDQLADEMGEETPMLLPFNFLPSEEKPGYIESWNYEAANDKIDIQLSVEGSSKPKGPASSIQLQYIVLPTPLVEEKSQSQKALKQMSYEEVLKTFDLTI